MQSNNQPLVSVPVVTYNSAKTIVETLDSIYNQTYPNIELIVSDDCSKDNTVEIVREWLDSHKSRFVRTELITIPENRGVSANYNRAASACHGEWIKDFDGDDIMLPHCIQTYMDYVSSHPETIYVFSKIEVFGGDETRRKKMIEYGKYDFFTWSPKEQYDYLTLKANCIYSMGSFYNRQAMIDRNIVYDERIPLIEDWSRWIILLQKGVKLDFIDEVLSLYRMSENSLSTQTTPSVAFQKSYFLTYKYYRFKNDYKHGDKKTVIMKYLRGERLLHDNNIVWRLICKVYRICVLHQW